MTPPAASVSLDPSPVGEGSRIDPRVVSPGRLLYLATPAAPPPPHSEHRFARQFVNSVLFTWIGNGARIAPGARLDDGLLDMVIFEERSRLATLRALPRLFTSGVERVRGVTRRPVTAATVESDLPMVFHVDGEPVQGGTRLEARVRPGVLHVAAP